MNVDPLLNKLQEFENNKHIDFQKELLSDLLKFKETFLEELKATETSPNTETKSPDVAKLEYRIEHLKESYAELYRKYKVDVEKISRENELLREKLKNTLEGCKN